MTPVSITCSLLCQSQAHQISSSMEQNKEQDTDNGQFFALLYLFPFNVEGASVIHLAALHQYGSNSPLGCLTSDV